MKIINLTPHALHIRRADGSDITIEPNGVHSGNHWLRVRRQKDGTIWVRVPQCFGYEVAA